MNKKEHDYVVYFVAVPLQLGKKELKVNQKLQWRSMQHWLFKFCFGNGSALEKLVAVESSWLGTNYKSPVFYGSIYTTQNTQLGKDGGLG